MSRNSDFLNSAVRLRRLLREATDLLMPLAREAQDVVADKKDDDFLDSPHSLSHGDARAARKFIEAHHPGVLDKFAKSS